MVNNDLESAIVASEEMLALEIAYVKTRAPFARKMREEEAPRMTGLALSGGGIRSAAFACGVMQSLARADVIGRFDYLSTTSGGSYIGASLSWHCRDLTRTEQHPTLDETNYPLGQTAIGGISGDTTRSVKALNFVRQNASYLVPGNGINRLSMATVGLRAVAVGSMVYFPIVFAFLMIGQTIGILGQAASHLSPLLTFALPMLLAGFLFYTLVYALSTRFQIWHRRPYHHRIRFQVVTGFMAAAALAFVTLGTLPLIFGWLRTSAAEWLISGGITLAGIVGFVAFFGKFNNAGALKGMSAQIKIITVATLLVYGVLLLLYGLVEILSDHHWAVQWGVTLSVSILSVCFGQVTDLNYVSLHRMVRDRLMELFLPNVNAVESGCWSMATEANRVRLSSMCDAENIGPYQLINANVVLFNSRNAAIRGRGGDSFLLSPQFCGSHATGYRATRSYMHDRITLATAMAISGAAINPGAGVGGRGATRNRIVSSLMTAMNCRTGYWVSNPANISSMTAKVPNFWSPGLNSLLGRCMSETPDQSYVELTDGGHFDNLGLYELVRRRLDTIVVSDAGEDRNFQFTDLGNAIQRVRVDFGVDIRFEEECDLSGLIPEPIARGRMGERYGVSHRGFAIARISYPEVIKDGQIQHETKDGLLFYIKTSLIKGLPADIYAYKSEYPTFPDQSTGDQFFDERQFEAYRELGYQLCKSMLKHNLTHDYLRYL